MNLPKETTPISQKARVQSIDTLRGIALLGVLLMNIIAFANPFAAYYLPSIDGADTGVNLAVFMFMDIFVEGSMRTIFSMLFGVGLLIFINKPSVEPRTIKSLFYRRTLLLVAFGLFNSYILLWLGDILYVYGMTGLVLYWFRDLSAEKLAGISAGTILLLSILHVASHMHSAELGGAARAIEALPAGVARSFEQEEVLQAWGDFLNQQYVGVALAEQQLRLMQSGYIDNFLGIIPINFLLQTIGFLATTFWDALAMMLLGMALFKWGFFDCSRTSRAYGVMALIGLSMGLSLNTWETLTFVNSGFHFEWAALNRPTYDLGRLSLALGYIGLIMLICKLGFLKKMQGLLAKVGQMALTNYLSHSLICNFIFMGWGLELAGTLQRIEIYYLVMGIWVFQIITSSLWLTYFRYGPAEWVWRSITYQNRQPFQLI
ncbi:MAG: hypothetical protein CMD92_08970 [Gammaproteobacteria bacterium]|nr:hypothetical protein [Gammaproteobacteria bacterium]